MAAEIAFSFAATNNSIYLFFHFTFFRPLWMKLGILLVEKVVQIVPESPKAYILREMTSKMLTTSGASYDFYPEHIT